VLISVLVRELRFLCEVGLILAEYRLDFGGHLAIKLCIVIETCCPISGRRTIGPCILFKIGIGCKVIMMTNDFPEFVGTW
jgi:hypothetical protein